MRIFILITFVLAIFLCIGSTVLVILLGLKRRRLNRPYHIREYQEFVKKEKPVGGKLSLSEKFKDPVNVVEVEKLVKPKTTVKPKAKAKSTTTKAKPKAKAKSTATKSKPKAKPKAKAKSKTTVKPKVVVNNEKK